jgi:hypothetical protein
MDYSGDTHLEGNKVFICIPLVLSDTTVSMVAALTFMTEFCCDHQKNGFELGKYFPGPILTGP